MSNALSTSVQAALEAAPAPAREQFWRVAARMAFPFLVVGALWELVAHAGLFPPRLFSPLEVVAAAFVRLPATGILPHHVADTLVRLLAGFALAALAGGALRIALGGLRVGGGGAPP